MARQDLLVPARYYQRLDDVLIRHGFRLRDALAQMSLTPDAFDAPDSNLRYSQVERLITVVERLTGRYDLGFELGELLTLSTHSIVGFGMLASPTIEDAIRFVARYFRLVMPSFKMKYVGKPDRGELHFRPVIAMSHRALAFHLEVIAMAALRDVKDMIQGGAPPLRIEFSTEEPRHGERYRSLRDVKCFFGALPEPGVSLIFGADFCRYRMPMSDANALKVAEERCQARLPHLSSEKRYSEWVTMTLREVGNGGPSLDEMARLLNLSSRTLARYLQHEGTAYRDLAATVHYELACARLLGGSQSVTEIAYSLGYTSLSNFTRAFRVQANCSPSEFRERVRRPPVGSRH
ncbi:AraC family transcriptional regulator [Solimonas marina]|uniref:AraC family transcriptional regulator n=1 Tax=Solimonas marina TaxID=2714601 RepID=A0A970BBK2_9GAMM|nr:AraC family transcriptional regulator [Solimonas marina]NKF24531.1 AraC family transcriptional regulator [Solimonas marina]